MGLKEESKKRLQRYRTELRLRRLRTTVGLSIVGCIAIILTMAISGDQFDSFLRALGLRAIWNEERGVYADCSRSENKQVKFCQPKSGARDGEWKSLRGGEGYIFSLGK
jgi:hypothetical protein